MDTIIAIASAYLKHNGYSVRYNRNRDVLTVKDKHSSDIEPVLMDVYLMGTNTNGYTQYWVVDPREDYLRRHPDYIKLARLMGK